MKITFLDCTKTQYNAHTLRSRPLGGIESTTVSLAEAFAKRGHDVCVVNYNKADQPQRINGVYWSNYTHYDFCDPAHVPDVVIANNDAPLLDHFPSTVTGRDICEVLWLHNPVKLFKTIKKGRIWPLIRRRPIAVFLGETQRRSCSSFHPFKERLIMPHALEDSFLSQGGSLNQYREKQAIFFSQPYRGFQEVVDLWIRGVAPKDKDARLKAYVGDISLSDYGIGQTRKELEQSGIHIMPKVEKSILIEDLKKSRCMIYPGHIDETFCVAALEANALGVPIVTYGRGSLSERVIDGGNGFLVEDSNEKGVVNRVRALLNEDALFQDMSNNALMHIKGMTWDDVARRWEEYVFKNN